MKRFNQAGMSHSRAKKYAQEIEKRLSGKSEEDLRDFLIGVGFAEKTISEWNTESLRYQVQLVMVKDARKTESQRKLDKKAKKIVNAQKK